MTQESDDLSYSFLYIFSFLTIDHKERQRSNEREAVAKIEQVMDKHPSRMTYI